MASDQDYRRYRVYKAEGKSRPSVYGQIEKAEPPTLGPGEVLIESEYSSINYKDALAITGKGAILKSFPLVPGIDVAGRVAHSTDSRFRVGEPVLVTGCGLGEAHDGGFSQYVRFSADSVVAVPKGLTTKEAMILGTAGFTAGLALYRLEHNGLKASDGPVVVTGASGGVGSIATHLLSSLGYKVIAVSGKKEQTPWLESLGASEVLAAQELKLGSRPLESSRFAAVIDNLGGETLAKLAGHIRIWGSVACVGLAEGSDLRMTVMPLILRGVSLLGISSNNCTMNLRQEIWRRFASEWRIDDLKQFQTEEIGLNDLEATCARMIERKTHGRILVKF